MTDSSKNLSLQDFLASLQFPFQEYVDDKNERINECFSDQPGTSQNPTVLSNPNVDGYNLEDLDEYLTNEVGILNSSDVSTDSEPLDGKSEEDVTEYLSADALTSDSLDENSDASDFPLEDFENDLSGHHKLLSSSLALNRKLQKKLTEALENIKSNLKEKEAQMKKFQEVKESEIIRKSFREPQFDTKAIFLYPYFAEPRPIEICPPHNEDTLARSKANENTVYLREPKPWSSSEKATLLTAVKEISLEYVLKPYSLRLNYLKDKIKEQRKSGCLVKYQEIEMKDEIARLNYNIKQKSAKSTEEIIEEVGDNIDWMRISVQFFEGLRSEEDCELRWKNFLSIFINKKPFSKAEDKRLKKIVERYNEKNWDLIARELKTGRSAVQCFIRYQRDMNRKISKKGPFTAEEEENLRRIIEEVRIGDYIPWIQVHHYIHGRTSAQLSRHYNRHIKDSVDKSNFTKEEDAMILACTKKFGTYKSFKKMEKYLPNRSATLIRSRYFQYLNPVTKLGPWSEEENFKLLERVKKLGFGKWKQIARRLHGRSTLACKNHITTLLIRDKNTNEIRLKTPEEIRQMSKNQNFTSSSFFEKRRNDIINSAHETLKHALEKICYYLKQPLTMDNLSLISFPGLRMLQKELLKHKKKSIEFGVNSSEKTAFETALKSPESDAHKSASNSEDEVETNLDEHDIESNWLNPKIRSLNLFKDYRKTKEIEEGEGEWLEEVLLSQFKAEESRKLDPLFIRELVARQGLSSTMEYKICEEYLLQQLKGSKTSIRKEDDDTCVMNGLDYKISVPEVINRFVHPPVSKDQMLILPPNIATIDTLDYILELDSTLRKTADLVDHSIMYIQYLLGLSKNEPKCVHCSLGEKDNTSHEDYKAAIDQMKSCLLIPTEELKLSAMVETTFPALQLKECSCNELVESKKTVDKLIKHMITFFYWPYFLHSFEPTKQQSELLFRPGIYKYKNKPKKRSKRRNMESENDSEESSTKKPPKKKAKDTKVQKTDNESDSLSFSSTAVQDTPTQSHTVDSNTDEVEMVCLSDTHEDFS